MADETPFTDVIGALDYPMLIVTAAAAGERAGCLIGFSTPASIDPARFLVCLSNKNRTYRLAHDARRLAIHAVPAEGEALAELFGGETGDELDKFERCAWEPGPDRVPLLRDCPVRMSGPVIDFRDLGDHGGFLVEPDLLEHEEGFQPFRTDRGERIEPGHEP